MDSIQKITIDVSDPLNTQVVKAVQEDIRSRYVEITLVRNGEPLSIPASAHGMIGIRRPNGTYVLYDETEDQTSAVTIDGNVVTAYLSQEALAIEGDLYTSVSIYTASQRLTAFHFIVSVEATAVPSGVVVESDYFNILEGVVSDAIDAAERAEEAAATVADVVSYGTAQTLTDAQKLTARTNIGAAETGAAPAAHHSTHEIGGSDALPAASTTKAGLVQLYDDVDSSSTTLAATAAAVKKAAERSVFVSIVKSTESGQKSVPTSGFANLASISLTAGVWFITAYAFLPMSASSSRGGVIVLSAKSANGTPFEDEARCELGSSHIGWWRFSMTVPANFAESKTLYLNAQSGGSSSVSASTYGITAVRIGDAV